MEGTAEFWHRTGARPAVWFLGAAVRSPLKPLAGALLPGKVQSRLALGGRSPPVACPTTHQASCAHPRQNHPRTSRRVGLECVCVFGHHGPSSGGMWIRESVINDGNHSLAQRAGYLVFVGRRFFPGRFLGQRPVRTMVGGFSLLFRQMAFGVIGLPWRAWATRSTGNSRPATTLGRPSLPPARMSHQLRRSLLPLAASVAMTSSSSSTTSS